MHTALGGRCNYLVLFSGDNDNTFASGCLYGEGIVWRISEHYTNSDYQAILLNLEQVKLYSSRTSTVGWISDYFGGEEFHLIVLDSTVSGMTAQNKMESIMKSIRRAHMML